MQMVSCTTDTTATTPATREAMRDVSWGQGSWALRTFYGVIYEYLTMITILGLGISRSEIHQGTGASFKILTNR